jgi:hypothetical protein
VSGGPHIILPGYMSMTVTPRRSLDQFLQARSRWLNARHPPVMSLIWMWLDRVVAGPFPMLVLQCGPLWGGGCLLVRDAGPRSDAARVAILVMALLALVKQPLFLPGYSLLIAVVALGWAAGPLPRGSPAARQFDPGASPDVPAEAATA